MKRLLVAIVVVTLFLPGLASALVYSPTVSELATWTAIGSSSTSNTFSRQVGSKAVKFSGDLYGQTLPEPSIGYLMIGKNYGTPLDLSSFDTYALRIYNTNESTWNYSLFAQDSYGYTAVSLPFLAPIPVETNAVFELDLAAAEAEGLVLEDIISIGLFISQKVPIPADPVDDRTYETSVAPVPEPGTMMLLGAGFLGLAIYGKRRRNA